MPAILKSALFPTLAAGMILVSCQSDHLNQHTKDANSAAGKVGQLAYHAAKESGKAAKVAARDLSKAAHEAHEGWKEASKEDKSKH